MERESETIQQIKITAEMSPCGIGLFNTATSEPVFLNRAYYELVGYTPDEYQTLVTDSDMLMYPQDIAISHQSIKAFLESGVSKDCEYRIVRKDGQIRWVKLNATKIEIDGTEYAYTFFSDITKEKETYAQLVMIAENTNSSISVIRVNSDSEKLVYANEYFFELIGVSRNQYEKNMHDIDAALVSQADQARLLNVANEAISSGKTEEIEYQLNRIDGKRLWVSRRFRAIRNEDAKSYMLVSVVTDITRRKEAEIKMELQKQRFQMVVDELGAAIFEWNMKTGGFYCSDAYYKYAISTANPDDILANVGPSDLVHPDDQSIMLQYFNDTNSGKEKAEATLRLKMIDGSYRWCRMIGFFYKDESGVPTRTIGVIIDVNSEHEHSFIIDNILNTMPGGVGIFGFENDVTCEYYSDGFAKLGGYTREQIDEIIKSGNFIESLVVPADWQRVRRVFNEQAKKGLPINLNFRFLHHDNSVNWLHLSAEKMRDKDAGPLYYCIFSRPSKETEMYRSLVEDSAVGVFVGEMVSRVALFANRAICEICDFPLLSSNEGRSVIEILSEFGRQPLLTQKQISNLSSDTYTEYHLAYKKRYLSVRAKATVWHDVDAYIMYIMDETAEHENQKRLQKLIDEVPGGIGVYDIIDGKVSLTYLNNAYYEMLGMTRESRSQYYGANALAAIYEGDRDAVLAGINEIISGKNRAGILHRVCNGEGNLMWLNLEASVIERDSHHIRVYATFSNCDELIRTQESLKTRYEDQVRFAKMIASNSVASSMVNLTNKTITMQNTESDDIMTIITRQTPQQGFEAMYSCIPDDEIRHQYMEIFNEDRIIEDFEKGIERKSIRHPYMNYDCWYESTYTAVRNPKTNDIEVYCFARDVSQEIEDEDVNHRITEQTYDEVMLINSVTGEPQTLVENVASGVYDEQKNCGDYSKGLYRYIMSRSADEHPEKIAASLGLDAVNSALQSQDSYTVTYFLYDKNHNLVRRCATYSYLNKYKTKLICVIQDVTNIFERDIIQQRKMQAALEEAENASRAKADFYSRMSHDMRTPMNGILGMAELSKSETDSEKIKENIEKIRESGEYLLGLVNDTLDIQRIESGKMILEPKIVNTMDIVNNILDMIRVTAKAKGVNLKYNPGNTDLKWYIRADALRLKQIIVNLLSNAVKFTPSGGTVELEFKLLSRDGMISHDVIYVRDTGVGMSEEFLRDGIFKPFSQERNIVSNMYAGSGLGLSIAKSLIELMNGKIEVESELGVGTTFAVYLDFERVDNETARMAKAKQENDNKDNTEILHGKNILLVEDHPLNAEIGTKLLKRVGCQVVWAKNGQEAIECFNNMPANSFDAILMDIRMPVMDGLEATRRIRAMKKSDAISIPIVAMTANAYEEDVKASLGAGMNDHLGKPVSPNSLYEKLSECILANHNKKTE